MWRREGNRGEEREEKKQRDGRRGGIYRRTREVRRRGTEKGKTKENKLVYSSTIMAEPQ